MVAANDLDGDAIELVFMDPPAKPVAVMEKRTDALLGGIDDQYFLIRAQGLPRPRALEGRKHPAFDLAVDRITDIFLSRGVLHGGSQQRARCTSRGRAGLTMAAGDPLVGRRALVTGAGTGIGSDRAARSPPPGLGLRSPTWTRRRPGRSRAARGRGRLVSSTSPMRPRPRP